MATREPTNNVDEHSESVSSSGARARLEIVAVVAAISIEPDQLSSRESVVEDFDSQNYPPSTSTQQDLEVKTTKLKIDDMEIETSHEHTASKLNANDEASFSQSVTPNAAQAPQGTAEDTEASTEGVEFDIPQWFLDNCTKTAEQLQDCDVDLTIRDSQNSDSDTTEIKYIYQIDDVMYDALRAVRIPRTHEGEVENFAFHYDAVYLRYPVKVEQPKAPIDPLGFPYGPEYGRAYRPALGADPYAALFDPALAYPPGPDPESNVPVPPGTKRFLSLLVEKFAKESQADLITLGLDDLRDLVAVFAISQGEVHNNSAVDYKLVKKYCDHAKTRPDGPVDPYVDPYGMPMPAAHDDITGADFPFPAVLSSHQEDYPEGQANGAKQKALIVHIPEVQTMVATLGQKVLDIFKSEIEKMTKKCSVLFIFTSSEYQTTRVYSENAILSLSAVKPMQGPIFMAPSKSKMQHDLFYKQQTAEQSHLTSNIRRLQYALRMAKMGNEGYSILQPYSSWEFLGQKETLGPFWELEVEVEALEVIVHSIGSYVNKENIRSAVQAYNTRHLSLDTWWPAIQECHDESHGKKSRSKWAGFPTHVQKVVRQIEEEPQVYALEREYLELLVNPQEIEQGWADIEVEQRTKDTIVQLVNQSFASTAIAYGILKRARIGGTLLYGPPGTGKTQLARVVARECGAAMLCITAAAIEQKYVGDTERGIQALFKLGRMLYPSIIFIDEADGLLSSREIDHHDSSRNRKNQLLAEMDGLLQHKCPPFVLLATNFPRQLDHAVLRRVPSFLHLGLPLQHSRKKIFDIYLRDEHVDADVDTMVLASQTTGYSGSDIKTLCVQTALLCDSIVESNGKKMRHLKRNHFLDALRSCAPTVSRSALEEIRAFADQHDPHAHAAWLDQEVVDRFGDGRTVDEVLEDPEFD